MEDRGAWQATYLELQRVRHNLATEQYYSIYDLLFNKHPSGGFLDSLQYFAIIKNSELNRS